MSLDQMRFVLELIVGTVSLMVSIGLTIWFLLGQIEKAKQLSNTEAEGRLEEKTTQLMALIGEIKRDAQATHLQLGAFQLETVRTMMDNRREFYTKDDGKSLEDRMTKLLEDMNDKIDRIWDRITDTHDRG
jgi:hypothetical protein